MDCWRDWSTAGLIKTQIMDLYGVYVIGLFFIIVGIIALLFEKDIRSALVKWVSNFHKLFKR